MRRIFATAYRSGAIEQRSETPAHTQTTPATPARALLGRCGGNPHTAPPLTRVEITGGIRPEPGLGLTMPGELRERAALFHAIDRAATADGVVTVEEAAAFLRNFDATPEDGVFEATQQARLAGAFPERRLAFARFRLQW